MWTYERRLEYPVKICKPDPNAAQIIISQLGGPNGELGASLRYLNQRYTMTDRNVAGCLTDIGTEELAHMEIIGAILHQLTRNLTIDQIEVWPSAASGMAFSSATFQCTGDTIADLTEDMAAEQKARVTYDNILRLVDDPEVRDPIKFLREREIVHFQRFGECLRRVTDCLDSKNFYAVNPSFDR